jgi:hypothetical protein
MPGSHHPLIAKGRKVPFTVACSAWIDLLGYGSMLRDASFDPTDTRAAAAVRRLNIFHSVVAKHAARYMRVMVINDGAVSTRDLSYRSKSVTYDYLCRLLSLHHEVNEEDKRQGFPGARMVVAAGFRMRTPDSIQTQKSKVQSILERMAKGTITATEAVWAAYRAQPPFGAAPELHANFAFTKAYLADQAGSKAGLGGPNCFLDTTLFTDPFPSWLNFRRLVDWSTPGMSGQFGELDALDFDAAGASHQEGVLDAMQLAKRLLHVHNTGHAWHRLGG